MSDTGATNAAAASVRLPRRDRVEESTSGRKAPIWSIDSAAPLVQEPLPAKCSMHDRDGGVCCRDLKDDDDRTLIDPDVLRDVVIGLSDGLTVPFALTAGLSSLGESKLVVLGGVAELIAGAISMGIGGFLASQAERDHYRFLKKHTSARIQRSCAGEIEREVFGVLGPVGVSRGASKEVASCLRELEDDQNNGIAGGSDEENGRLRWSNEVGISAFLLKFGEGLEDVPTRRLYISAFTIGMGYLLGGLIPLLPYFFIPVAHVALIWSCALTGVVLLIFGAIKARVTGAAKSFGSYIWGAVSTLLVGGAAAGAAYGIVAALET